MWKGKMRTMEQRMVGLILGGQQAGEDWTGMAPRGIHSF